MSMKKILMIVQQGVYQAQNLIERIFVQNLMRKFWHSYQKWKVHLSFLNYVGYSSIQILRNINIAIMAALALWNFHMCSRFLILEKIEYSFVNYSELT